MYPRWPSSLTTGAPSQTNLAIIAMPITRIIGISEYKEDNLIETKVFKVAPLSSD
jgi:hypothetical protein